MVSVSITTTSCTTPFSSKQQLPQRKTVRSVLVFWLFWTVTSTVSDVPVLAKAADLQQDAVTSSTSSISSNFLEHFWQTLQHRWDSGKPFSTNAHSLSQRMTWSQNTEVGEADANHQHYHPHQHHSYSELGASLSRTRVALKQRAILQDLMTSSTEEQYSDDNEEDAFPNKMLLQQQQRYLQESSADQQRKAHPDRITSYHTALPPLPSRMPIQQRIRNMFQHAYDSYMYHAFPASDIRPLTCEAASFDLVKLPALTLMDSLDTIFILGNYTEFARSVERLRQLHHPAKSLFAQAVEVSVFETTIRILGGLLSAHQLALAYMAQPQQKVYQMDVWKDDTRETIWMGRIPSQEFLHKKNDVKEGQENKDDDLSFRETSPSSWMEPETSSASTTICTEFTSFPKQSQTDLPPSQNTKNKTLPYWEYDGFLLELAQDLGDRILPAFDTKTGIPYGTVNLMTGVPEGETPIASLAGAGTLSLEMELLSRLTGNHSYGKAAKRAMRALWMRRSPKLDLVGKHICSRRGEWTETASGIGSNSDSYYEYLLKHYILFPEDADFWILLVQMYSGIFLQMRAGDWHGDVDMVRGAEGVTRRVLEALMAFYPGLQVLLGELSPAAGSLNSFFLVREHLGFLPERFNFLQWKVDGGGGRHFLRPELLESAYFIHRATKGFQQPFRNGTQEEAEKMDASGWQWAAEFALRALEEKTKAVCGYTSIHSVSPNATGDLAPPSGRQRALKNTVNEMPSFFLSETLKYLYLMFDEGNLLHHDPDREWVFTTEAHPIHHVPSNFTTEDDEQELDALKHRLVEKLQARKSSSTDQYRGDDSWQGQLATSLHGELWTESTPLTVFLRQMAPLAQEAIVRSLDQLRLADSESYGPESWLANPLVQPLVVPRLIPPQADFYREIESQTNPAHLTFQSMGKGDQLSQSCPNFYLPDWRWIQAVNGGSMDYSDAYVSSVTDSVSPTETSHIFLGSGEAIAWLGAKQHPSEMQERMKKCTIPRSKLSLSEEQSSTERSKKQSPSDPRSHPRQTVSMGEELGEFSISPFPDGGGFFIESLKNSEAIVATFIQGVEDDAEMAFAMVYATSSDDGDDVGGDNISSMEKSTVIMADAVGNSYRCQVQVLTKNEHHQQLQAESEQEDEILATYPCAPAMFGPVNVSRLVESQGLIVEAPLRSPDVGDEYGCSAGEEENELTPQGNPKEARDKGKGRDLVDGAIHLVHRGICTFEDKAWNQKHRYGASGVLVVNNAPEDLFVMSGGSHNEEQHTVDNYPPTVLISGNQGQELLALVKSAASHDSSGHDTLLVRISLTMNLARVAEEDGKFVIADSLFWPVVFSQPGQSLEVFSRWGWGVRAALAWQANEQQSADERAGMEWQLYLLRHETNILGDYTDENVEENGMDGDKEEDDECLPETSYQDAEKEPEKDVEL